MNILWVPNFSPFPPDNGGKLLTYNRMVQVSKKNRIYLIVESECFDDYQKQEAERLCEEYYVIKPITHNKITNIFNTVVKCRNVEKYRNIAITQCIIKILENHNIDIITFDLPMPAVNILPISKEIGMIPVVINQQNVEFHNCKSKIYTEGISFPLKMYSLIESSKLYRWEKKLYTNTIISANSFVSSEDMELFDNSFKKRPRIECVMPIGTNMPSNIIKPESGREKKIVFPASFDYSPNVHGAVWFVENVWPVISKKIRNVKLYLVGRDPRPEIKAFNSDKIIVTGTVESVEPYFAMADIFIVPIFFGGGVKTKLIEMGCWKRPVISTTFGAKGTIYGTDDLLIKDDIDSFAEVCIDALENPNRYSELVESMFEKTKDNYLWESVGVKYIDFLENMVIEKEI